MEISYFAHFYRDTPRQPSKGCPAPLRDSDYRQPCFSVTELKCGQQEDHVLALWDRGSKCRNCRHPFQGNKMAHSSAVTGPMSHKL